MNQDSSTNINKEWI